MKKCIIGDSQSRSYSYNNTSASVGSTWNTEPTQIRNDYATVWNGGSYSSSPMSTPKTTERNTEDTTSYGTYYQNYSSTSSASTIYYCAPNTYTSTNTYNYFRCTGSVRYNKSDSVLTTSFSAYLGLKATVAPTVYLKDTLVITGGLGTETDPYTLGPAT